jgi:hypothetical protein
VEPAIDSADCRSANLSSSPGRGSGRPWPGFLLPAHVRPVTHLGAPDFDRPNPGLGKDVTLHLAGGEEAHQRMQFS